LFGDYDDCAIGMNVMIIEIVRLLFQNETCFDLTLFPDNGKTI